MAEVGVLLRPANCLLFRAIPSRLPASTSSGVGAVRARPRLIGGDGRATINRDMGASFHPTEKAHNDGRVGGG